MSGEPYFLVDAVPSAGRYLLDGDEGRHAATVRRLRAAETLILTDGRGTWAPATVIAVARGALTLDVGAAVTDRPVEPRVVVVQALPKGERSDLAVDLATEAGADEIVPWQAERCVARWSASSDKAARGRAKWQATARAAAKQSRRSRVPVIGALATGADVAAVIRDAACALVLHESGSVPFASVPLPTAGAIVVVVGPEGGVSPAEIAAFEAAGATAVRLGPEVLRTSAAAAVALGAIGARTGRWG